MTRNLENSLDDLEAHLTDAPARVIGGARVDARIGEGTLGEVFRGEQQSLGRAVAIKILRGSISPTSQLGKRFAREGALLSRFAHQNLPLVFATGEVGDRPFIVMEFVDGTTLRALLDKAPGHVLPVDVALVIGLKIVRALEHLHMHAVVHRDVKPANVLLSMVGEVKLVDLGIARDLKEEDDRLGVVGTPAYMSPEQVLGDRLDFRSDVFSFGIVLYEMLTGTRPFQEDPARTVMQKIRLDRYRPVRTVRRDAPGALEQILARCLEKNPAHRYASTGALCDDLGELLARRMVHAHEARLIQYLVERGILPEAQGRKALGPAGAFWTRAAVTRRGQWLAIALQLVAGLGVATSIVLAERTRSRSYLLEAATVRGPQPEGTPHTGLLRVVAHPWARVFIDSVPVDTTPTARTFRLATGGHVVRLTHPLFEREERVVQIEEDTTVWLDVELTRPKKAH